MATKKRKPSRPRDPEATKAHRSLIFFVAVIVILYILMFLTGERSPRLGLDLRGGTTVTLTASAAVGGGGVNADSLEQAKQIIQQRVDGLGVGEASVSVQGNNNIVVSAPNANRDELVKQVGTTALLSFRNVFAVQPVTPEPLPSPSPSGSASPGATPTPSVPAATGLPTAPPSPRPTAPGQGLKTFDERLQWQPTAQDQADFANFQCSDTFPDVADQPLITCDDLGTAKYLLGPELIAGASVKDASAQIPTNQVQWVVQLQFNTTEEKDSTLEGSGAKRFAQVTQFISTQQEPMNQFAITLDSKVISAPVVNEAIPDGQAQISGTFNQESAQQLANILKYGSLPLKFEASSIENVSPTLGGEQLHGGIIAGLIGLVLVIGYSVFYYRGLAVVVIGSLIGAVAITYPTMVLLGQAVGFALNLPAIAGAIIAIGMTADSFIIFFERIRDEIREGRPLRSSITAGWKQARGTIIVAKMVSILSAFVLFFLAIGGVRGFAFTLGLTTFIDLFIVFYFTFPIMVTLARTKFYGEGRRGSGLNAEHMGVSRASLLGRKRTRLQAATAEA